MVAVGSERRRKARDGQRHLRTAEAAGDRDSAVGVAASRHVAGYREALAAVVERIGVVVVRAAALLEIHAPGTDGHAVVALAVGTQVDIAHGSIAGRGLLRAAGGG